MLGTVLGGAAAAALGAGTVIWLDAQGWLPGVHSADEAAAIASAKAQGEAIADLRRELDALTTGIADLRGKLPDPAAAADLDLRLSALAERFGPVASAQSEFPASLAALDERLTALEQAPSPGIAGAPAQSAPQLDEMRRLAEEQKAAAAEAEKRLAETAAEAEARLRAAEAEAVRLKAEAEATAKTASARAALSHLQAALESGAPIEPPLADLAAAGVAIPQSLADQSGGVPSAEALKAGFPEAARAALALSLRETAGEGVLSRALAFIRAETGARSLSPRAGDDPDAILSRAEAALDSGDLAGAIAEISALPQAGRDRMAEWLGLAQRRIAALDALKALSESMD
ncbi:MAG: COG4223 family protein [Paracoccaceae bacterium]